ncbi:MAG: DNA repair protein RadA [Clostridia bacterium]|nr:DNA repair protein RadA [Clostridia bacterium]
MAATRSIYVCSQCGYESAKWYGKCPDCGQWNSMTEELRQPTPKAKGGATASRSLGVYGSNAPVKVSEIGLTSELRYSTGLGELDRVLGGGIVKGSLVLLGGDPGIGKSTILLQICQHLCDSLKVLYVSGEESARQLKLRAQRLGVTADGLLILTETDVQAVSEHIKDQKPDLVIIDSIQTMCLDGLSSSPGSVTQVRECTNYIMHVAKQLEIPVFIVGHVNKDGAIAGPKVLEHIVDAVLYFEGDKHLSYRILRAVKNRYGSTNEIGVFEMTDTGLAEVENPSLALLSGRPKNVSGTCVACVMEGSRPILSEIQGLAAPTGFGNPRRSCVGFDFNRMNLLLAVLEKRAGYYFSSVDAYLNVVGGLRLDEPAADLPAALALVSSQRDFVIDEGTVAFGEIGLAGEVRSVSNCADRVKEAQRLGFARCILPYHNFKKLPAGEWGIELVAVRSVRQAVEAVKGE